MSQKKIYSICIVVEGFPYQDDPKFSFVEVLCLQLAARGVSITVISPQSILHRILKGFKAHPTKRTYYPEGGGAAITVLRPWTLILPHKFVQANEAIYKRAVEKTFKNNHLNPDVCYGHFWQNAYYISEIAENKGIPLFVASGEGNFDDLETLYKSEPYQKFSKRVRGVICVSSSCRDISVEYGLTTVDKCKVILNAIDNNKFYIKDRKTLRSQYGIPHDKFIIAFVGAFIQRKGSNRLSDAISMLNDDDICSFFIGKGLGPENFVPTCKGVLFCGSLAHDSLIDYLNMADIFVLPTLNEGCCNAIIEAMACGLPVVSSDKPFNKDILNEGNSILIDPMNIKQIADAIKRLKDEPEYRNKLSQGAIEAVSTLRIENRAKVILDFMESKLNK